MTTCLVKGQPNIVNKSEIVLSKTNCIYSSKTMDMQSLDIYKEENVETCFNMSHFLIHKNYTR